MLSRFIEATDATEFNHGKFMVARFTVEEWKHRSKIAVGSRLLSHCGWHPQHILVWDMQTGEGAIFLPGGQAKADLDKHQIWVCPMFEPFLMWLYRQELADIMSLPEVVNLGDVPTALFGYRREGRRAGNP